MYRLAIAIYLDSYLCVHTAWRTTNYQRVRQETEALQFHRMFYPSRYCGYVWHSNPNLASSLSLCAHSIEGNNFQRANPPMHVSTRLESPQPKTHKERLRELRARRTREKRFNKYAHTFLAFISHVFLFFSLLMFFFGFQLSPKNPSSKAIFAEKSCLTIHQLYIIPVGDLDSREQEEKAKH